LILTETHFKNASHHTDIYTGHHHASQGRDDDAETKATHSLATYALQTYFVEFLK
jgi:hypothetical protein